MEAWLTTGDAPNQSSVRRQILTSISITGTSIKTPTTVARAAPEERPKSMAAGGELSYWINGSGVPGLPPYSTGYLNWYQWAILAGVSIPWAVVGANTAHLLPAKQLKYLFIIVMFYMGLKMCGTFAFLKLPL